MSAKNDTEVIIGGKVFTISGYESEEYLQKVASYINNKYIEYQKIDSFHRLPIETQNVLLHLNIADDYFKAKNQIEVIEQEVKDKALLFGSGSGRRLLLHLRRRLAGCRDGLCAPALGTGNHVPLVVDGLLAVPRALQDE